MSNHLMGFGSFGLEQVTLQPSALFTTVPTATRALPITQTTTMPTWSPTTMLATAQPSIALAPTTTFAPTILQQQLTKTQMPAGTPYIQQQVDNLRANLIATRSSDPINLCKDPAFINAFHPKGFIYGCASQQVRMNGSPFRQALRNSLQTMQVSYQQYGGENPFNIAAPLATMIVQESDMTANDAAKYIGEDMQFSGVAASTIKRVTAGGVVETQLFQIPGVTIGEAVLPGGPDEGFVVPFDTWEQPGVPPPGEPGVVEADILIEAQERAEEDAKDMQKYLLWGLVAGGVLIGGYLLFGRKT